MEILLLLRDTSTSMRIKVRVFPIAKGQIIEYLKAEGIMTNEFFKQYLSHEKYNDAWQDHGVKEGVEYAILTNESSKAWSGIPFQCHITKSQISM